MAAPLLVVSGLQAFYGDSQALFDITLDVHEGEVVSLLGRNGMGKTTTVSSIMGLIKSKAGRIEFNGRRIDEQSPFRIARAGMGLVPEGRQVFPNLSVHENLIATASNYADRAEPWTIDAILEFFPQLHARLNVPGALLSGGEQQMLAIGRALMTNPRLLILDEATEGLAPLIREEIWGVLQRLSAQRQSILVIDKNVSALTHVATRHYILEKGRTVWSGSSEDLLGQPEIQRRYLGLA